MLIIKRFYKKVRLVYVCGLGATGSLGLPRYYRPDKTDLGRLKHKDAIAPSFRRLNLISYEDNITDIACGYGFTVIVGKFQDSTHTALGFGLNSYSQIGYHATRTGFPLEIVATPSPIWLPTKNPINRVSCGRSHTLLCDSEGSIFSIGNNSLGQCGREIVEKERYFGSKKVHRISELPSDIKQIACGQDHSLFLTQSGEVYSCGWGADGQTGLGHFDNQALPCKIRGYLDGVMITKISTSADTCLALDVEGNVFGWGNSEYAQFNMLADCEFEQTNLPVRLNMIGVPGRIVDIAAGGTMCSVLNDAGQVYVWGFGLLGKGPEVEQSSLPTLIPESLFGRNQYNPNVKVVKIFAGLSQFAAITNEGELYTWGKNRGQLLGLPHLEDQCFPMNVSVNLASVCKIALGVDHSCVIGEKVC